MTNVFSRRITTREYLGDPSHRDIWISFYERSGSLFDILESSENFDGVFPIVVSNNVNKEGKDYVVSLPPNQVYVASREFLDESLEMSNIAEMIDARTSRIRDIVNRLTPVTIDIVGDGVFFNDNNLDRFLVFSNATRANRSIVYVNVEDLVDRKKVDIDGKGKECYLKEISPSNLGLSLDHNFRVGDESSSSSVGGVKIVLKNRNLYVGVGIYVDNKISRSQVSGAEVIQPIGKGNKDYIRNEVINTLASYL